MITHWPKDQKSHSKEQGGNLKPFDPMNIMVLKKLGVVSLENLLGTNILSSKLHAEYPIPLQSEEMEGILEETIHLVTLSK